MTHKSSRRELLNATAASLALAGIPGTLDSAALAELLTKYNYAPKQRNVPLGIARGIYPGRVVWVRDPKAAHWSGDRESVTDQWWMDASTDQARVDSMVSLSIQHLTGAKNDAEAWKAIFRYYGQRYGREKDVIYRAGEIVAVKVNLNNSKPVVPTNLVNVSPQVTLAVVRQLVHQVGVAPQNIVVYDAQRNIYPGLLNKIWNEYKDVRFVQRDAPDPAHQAHPAYGTIHGLEQAQWVEGQTYSANHYENARFIPQQIKDATYLVNLALVKAHSYPYAAAEGGDEGQTGVTLTGKNHFGSIKGPGELHSIINTNQGGTPHAYSPIVDLSASPNLGAKTILYLLDGLYGARRHMSYPLHFPNAPFFNRLDPYENSEWPASILASLDGVALDSVGLDILYSQTKNNLDENGHPRIMIRENADDYLMEEALAEHPPSGTSYVQDGKPVTSLGVFEHWDSEESRKYSRNLHPHHHTGIELIYIGGNESHKPDSQEKTT
jgi:uncharacterized protein (DUF362 family)